MIFFSYLDEEPLLPCYLHIPQKSIVQVGQRWHYQQCIQTRYAWQHPCDIAIHPIVRYQPTFVFWYILFTLMAAKASEREKSLTWIYIYETLSLPLFGTVVYNTTYTGLVNDSNQLGITNVGRERRPDGSNGIIFADNELFNGIHGRCKVAVCIYNEYQCRV